MVYVDRIFFLNALLDYLLLLATARLAGVPLRRKRFVLCAVLGGLYAAAVFLPNCHILAHPLAKLLFGVAMALFAFIKETTCWRLVLLFFMLSGTLAGAVMALGLVSGAPRLFFSRIYYADISWSVLLSAAFGFYFLLHLVFRQGARHGGGELMDVTVSIGGKEQRVRVLHDTGNTLRDPVNAQPVLVLERRVLREYWTKDEARLLSEDAPPEEKLAQLYRRGTRYHFSLLPFRSVGVTGGLLLAVRSDYIRIGRKKYPRILIALSDGALSDGGGYYGLWGGEERGEDKHGQAMAAEDPVVAHTAGQNG